MLEALRSGAQSWVAKILFALLIASFAVWGIGDTIQSVGRGSLATVGSTHITATEFQQAYQNELSAVSRQTGQRITAEQGRAFGLDQRVLTQMTGGAAVEQHAHDLHLALSDAELAAGVQRDPDFRGADGKFSKAGFEQLLDQMGLSERGFFAMRRRDELRKQLLFAMVSGLAVPKPMIDIEHAYRAEKRVIEHLTIDEDKVIKVPPADDVKLKAVYDTHLSSFMTPEYRKLSVLVLSLDDVKKTMSISDTEIATAYEQTKAAYDTPEKRRVQQIAFKDKAAAEAAKKALASGKLFGDVAKEAGAKETDVDLGLVEREQLFDPKIRDVAFSIAKDTISDVVEGRFTTVLVRVVEIQPAVTKTLADVKDQVRDKLATEKAGVEIQKIHDDVEDNRSAGKALKDIASGMKLTHVDIEATDAKGSAPDGTPALTLPDPQKIVESAFSADPGLEREGIELAGGGFAWVDAISKTPPRQKTFEEVKADVTTLYNDTELRRLVDELAKTLVERANKGEALSALESAAGATVEKTPEITRKTAPQGLTEAGVAQAFTLGAGKAGSAETSDKRTRTILRVAEIIPAKPATDAEATVIRNELASQMANEQVGAYITALQQKLGVTVNAQELKRAIGVPDAE